LEAAWGDAGLTGPEVARRVTAAYGVGDTDTLLALLDPEVELVEWPDAPESRTFRGHDGAREAMRSWAEAWEWLRSDIEEIVEVDDRVLVCCHTRGKGRGSAVEVETGTYNVFTVRDGHAIRIQFFTSKEPALEAAGLQGERAR
jgi:ketosteroid isomerase-like protein